MPATALIKFTQGLTVGVAGQALKGTTGVAVTVQNGDNTGVRSWEIELLYRDPAGAVAVGILAASDDGTTPIATFTPDVKGCWRLRLRVWDQVGRPGSPLATDTDIRVFAVPETHGIVLPSPERWPRPLPTPESGEAGAKASEVNFSGQPNGWAGNATNDGLMNDALRRLDGLLVGFGLVVLAGDVTGPANSNTLGVNVVQDTQIRQSVALSVIGRNVNSVGNVGDIATTSGSAGVLRESGGVLGFGTIAAGGIADGAVTDPKLRNSVGLSVIGRSASTTGPVADIVGTADQVLRVSADGLTLVFGKVALGSESAITGLLSPTHIAPGSDGQVLQTVSGAATWATPSFGTPVDVGTANDAGSGSVFSRHNHVHALTFAPVQTVLAGATSAVSFNSQKITNVANPTNALDVTNKQYVDAAITGLKLLDPAVAVAVANQATLTGTAQTIDGVALNTNGMRVLLTAQTTGTQNGLWVVGTPWTRPADFATGSSAALSYVPITGGTVYAGSGWLDRDTVGSDVVDTDALDFGLFTQPSTILGGAGLLKTGNTIDVIANADATIVVNADDIKVGVIGNVNLANNTIALARLVNASAQNNFLMRKTASAGAWEDGTSAEARAALGIFAYGALFPVRAATTVNITLSGTQTVDGVALVAGNRCLVKDQSTGSQNGPYIVASGAWTRATDADGSGELVGGMLFPIAEGTNNGRRVAVLTTADPITIGSTALTFAMDRVVPVTSTAPSDITNTSAAVGTDTSAARADHVHRLTFTVAAAVLAVASASISVNTQKITNLATPTNPADATTKAYVDGLIGSSAGGSTGQIQYNNSGAFDGASGITVVGSEAALAFGATPAASGDLRFTYGSTGLVSKNQAGSGDVRALSVGTYAGGANTVKVGGAGANVIALDVQSGLGSSLVSLQIDGTQVALFNAAGFNMGGLAVQGAGYFSGVAGTNSTTGLLRGAYGELLVASSNDASAADVEALAVGTFFGQANTVKLGGSNAAGVALDFETGGLLSLQINSTQVAAFNAAGFNMGGLMVTGLAAPTVGSDATNKTYVDGLIAGLPGAGGSTGQLQYNNGGAFDGASGITVVGSETALSFTTTTVSTGDLRHAHGANVMFSRNQAGTQSVPLVRWGNFANDLLYFGSSSSDSGKVANMRWGAHTGGTFQWEINGTAEYSADATALTMNANNVVGAGFYSTSGTVAGAGLFRVANATDIIVARNAANNADLTLLRIDNVNKAFFGNNDIANAVVSVATGGTVEFRVNNAAEYTFSATDLNFIGNNAIGAGYYSTGGTVSSTGLFRIPNSTGPALAARGAGAYDVKLVDGVDGSDIIRFGDSARALSVYFDVKTGGNYQWWVNSASVAQLDATALALGARNLTQTTGFIQQGTNPASTALWRLPGAGTNVYAAARNNANDANINLLAKDTSNNVFVGDAAAGGNLVLDVATTKIVEIRVAASTEYQFSATALTMNGNNLLMGAGVVSFGTTPAIQGWLRVPTATGYVIAARNYDNSGEASIAYLTGNSSTFSDLTIGDGAAKGHNLLYLSAISGAIIQLAGVNEYTFGTTGADFTNNNLLMTSGQIRFGASGFATTGLINSQHATATLAARNQAGGADVILMNWGGSGNDILDIGGAGSAIAASIGYGVATGGSHTFKVNNTNEMILNSTSLDLVNNDILRGNVSDASATIFLIRGTGSTASNNSGGRFLVAGGRRAGSGNYGGGSISLNQDDSSYHTMVEVTHLANLRRVVALVRGSDITTTEMPTNTGDKVTYVGNAATVPSADAVNGYISYSDTARPAWRFNSTNLRLDGTASTATAGAAAALPNTPEGYLTVTLNGTVRKLPYYNT